MLAYDVTATDKKGHVSHLFVDARNDVHSIVRFVKIAKLNGETAKELVVSNSVGADGWQTVEVDLSKYAGKETKIEIVNQPNGWSWEAAYFAKIEVVEK